MAYRLPLVKPALPDFAALAPGLEEIVETGIATKGKFVHEFEEKVAQLAGTKEAVALSSCTTGLVLTHKLLNLTGEIIVPSFTFMASALGAVWNNLTPVFVDVDPDNWNIAIEDIEASITSKTSAVIATHVFGNPAPIAKLEEIARRHGLALIFDAAHGFGSLADGKSVGGNGDAEVFSCSPTKLVVCGEGGMVTTNNEELAFQLRRGREYGNIGNYDLVIPGLNGRMSEVNALMGLRCLDILDAIATRRNHLANIMKSLLKDVLGISWQAIESGNRSSFKDFTCRIDADQFGMTRDQLADSLESLGIETRKYYDPPCHLQSYWQARAKIGPLGLEVTESLSRQVLTLPLYSQMTEADIELLVSSIITLHHKGSTLLCK